ncbi:hypothetical protein EJ05DRAFT_394384 [Pseudovirgaria hyperparasitica]|uniref:GDP/GTP exchange factor Sec2 N-terminal domain-containing protein n=1 Tax=Pseudovirgaria hyperparasitica TaxID=470096 RepID=A0A6A6W4M6_9PEZI|nr:uncharacterized protein EJ05DRAFT_394384 [Pseudovirgaria hyperparasitica]KAF2757563.1 hypothetical protein EJ05DRAFT_394384 [Pseudovirgaria hyperparasitica]
MTTPSQTSSIARRSLTPTPKTPSRTKHLSHSVSTPHLHKDMAAVATAPRLQDIFHSDSDMLNTIPDPRSSTPATPISRQGSTDSGRHPDLSSEVATLSTKLVNAINHQTDLDDSLQVTRHELDTAKETIAKLQAQVKEHTDAVNHGLWIKRERFDAAQKEMEEERKNRKIMEKEKKRMESELENLTTALFEEANAMVAAARKETEASEKRNDQLKNQLQDSEILLRSHQDQLHDLKSVMEKMSERDESESNAQSFTAPSTPGVNAQDKVTRMLDPSNGSPVTPTHEETAPDHPLHWSHLINPVLRTDLHTYTEFQELLRQGRIFSNPPSRVGSGNYSTLNLSVLGSLTQHSNGSLTSLATLKSPQSTPSSVPGGSPRIPGNLPPLKETPFFKRAITEDIEPTLRLDQAPGVSWMGRRTVLTSIIAGSLVVEPHPPVKKHRGPVYACSMCGEARAAEQYSRKYRFKTSEAEDAQRYPLCDWCMGRLRATCDYVGFLRMVQAGHWRADSEEEQKTAWEEAVRFRERMFWSRIGGGVIPAISYRDCLRSPAHARADVRHSEDSNLTSSTTNIVEMDETKDDPFAGDSKAKRVSIGRTSVAEINGISSPESDSNSEPGSVDSHDAQELASNQLQSEDAIASAKLDSTTSAEPETRIPGSFD